MSVDMSGREDRENGCRGTSELEAENAFIRFRATIGIGRVSDDKQ